MDSEATRLFLITPPKVDAAAFPALLKEALGVGEVAAVLIAGEGGRAPSEEIAAPIVPIVQSFGAAALIADDTQLAGRVKADGVHVGTGLEELRLAAQSFRPKRIVGAGNLDSRHLAMQAGEIGADYVFFGRPQGDTHDEPYPKALDLAQWWSELMQIPAVVMAGRSLASIVNASATGAAFVAANEAIWSHVDGPAEAVGLALAALRRAGRQAT